MGTAASCDGSECCSSEVAHCSSSEVAHWQMAGLTFWQFLKRLLYSVVLIQLVDFPLNAVNTNPYISLDVNIVVRKGVNTGLS